MLHSQCRLGVWVDVWEPWDNLAVRGSSLEENSITSSAQEVSQYRQSIFEYGYWLIKRLSYKHPPGASRYASIYCHLSISVLHCLYVSMIHNRAMLLPRLGRSCNRRNSSGSVAPSLVLEHVELFVTSILLYVYKAKGSQSMAVKNMYFAQFCSSLIKICYTLDNIVLVAYPNRTSSNFQVVLLLWVCHMARSNTDLNPEKDWLKR